MTDAERRRKSFGIGYLLSLAGKPLPIAQREPVAYLYNGVQLPALPEWDRETYPYAWIYQVISTGECLLRISDTPVVRRVYPLYPDSTPSYYSSGVGCRFDNEDGQWNAFDPGWNSPFDNYFSESKYLTIWVSQDMYNQYMTDQDMDDTLYLAATDPIPVYE